MERTEEKREELARLAHFLKPIVRGKEEQETSDKLLKKEDLAWLNTYFLNIIVTDDEDYDENDEETICEDIDDSIATIDESLKKEVEACMTAYKLKKILSDSYNDISDGLPKKEDIPYLNAHFLKLVLKYHGEQDISNTNDAPLQEDDLKWLNEYIAKFIADADDNSDDDDDDSPHPVYRHLHEYSLLDKYLALKKEGKLKITEFTSRERRAFGTMLKNMHHEIKQFDHLWLMMCFFKQEYLTAVTHVGKGLFTFYNIVSYIYIKRNLCDNEIKKCGNRSLRQLSMKISELRIKDPDYYSESEVEDSENNNDPAMNDFKGFMVQCRRTLAKFFNFIFKSKSALNLFKINKTLQFNVADYGFISYLLSDQAYFQIDDLVKKRFDSVTEEFYIKIYAGLNLIAATHDVGLNKEIIDTMFTDCFKQDVNRLKLALIRFTFKPQHPESD